MKFARLMRPCRGANISVVLLRWVRAVRFPPATLICASGADDRGMIDGTSPSDLAGNINFA